MSDPREVIARQLNDSVYSWEARSAWERKLLLQDADRMLQALTAAGLAVVPRASIQKVHDIRADLADFDGDRRGHYAALEEAERALIKAMLAAAPDAETATARPSVDAEGRQGHGEGEE